VDGSYHPVDSSEMAFKIAANLAFKAGLAQANPVLLEPIGELKVVVPDNFTGDVMGDLNKRRGRVMGTNPVDDGETEIVAEVPMGEMGFFARAANFEHKANFKYSRFLLLHMKKWVCPVCGYVYEGENPPEKCPQCGVDGSKFTLQKDEMTWAAEHVVGIAKDVPEISRKACAPTSTGECSEVGMYLAMSRVAYREGYPEVGDYYYKAGLEEAEHAAKFAEMLGEVVTDSTKKNLPDARRGRERRHRRQGRYRQESQGGNLDAIHDTVHEMARDEARHGLLMYLPCEP
jgi:rubrerythrin